MIFRDEEEGAIIKRVRDYQFQAAHNQIHVRSGVPVNSKRRWVLKLISVCQRCDSKFLILWAFGGKDS